MTATSRIRGHDVTYSGGAWRTADGRPARTDAPCAACGNPPTPEGHDACLGTIPGAIAACCGHGHPEDAYVMKELPMAEKNAHSCDLPGCDGTRLGHDLAAEFPEETARFDAAMDDLRARMKYRTTPDIEATARIYLDVDGVLNAVNHRPPPWGWDEPVRVKCNGWTITYSPALIALLNDLADTPGLEVCWLTTWLHDAPSKLAPTLGLRGEKWQVVGCDHWRTTDPKVWWKLPAIQEHLGDYAGGVLWIDDDLQYDAAAKAWLAGQPNIVGLSPRTELGITRRQSRIISDFVQRLLTPAKHDGCDA